MIRYEGMVEWPGTRYSDDRRPLIKTGSVRHVCLSPSPMKTAFYRDACIFQTLMKSNTFHVVVSLGLCSNSIEENDVHPLTYAFGNTKLYV